MDVLKHNIRMSTLAHALSGAYFAVIAGKVAPHETGYIYTALASGALLDIDHLYYFAKEWKYYTKNGFVGTMHRARSVFHELVGMSIAAAVMFLLSFFDLKLAMVVGIPFMIHITEDMIMGKSTPFAPIDKTEMQVFPQKMKIKIVIDCIVISLFSILWILYLKGA